MTDNPEKKPRSLLDEIRQMRLNADKGREPKLLSSRMGTRSYSFAALVERIVEAFMDEHAGGSPALQEADTEGKRLKLVLATTNYVLAVESIQLADDDKAELIQRVYTELFSYGPLDALFDDDTVTTISLEGADKAYVRRGHGEFQSVGPIFENEAHLRAIIRRLLLDSGAELSEAMPIIEAGLRVGKRPICVNVAGQPVTILLSVDIRVHPAQPVTLADMVAAGHIAPDAAELLTAITQSEHGFIIVGDTESGKTTLLGALAELLPDQGVVTVERAGELHLPEAAERLVVQWPVEGREARSFADQVQVALDRMPRVILLDEIRTDEAQAVYPLLTAETVPRQIWAFRGPADSKRLISALGMLARRSIPQDEDKTLGEKLVRVMYERLPFVITLRRRKNTLQLHSISEWQFAADTDYPDFVELMAMGWKGIEMTGNRPVHTLNLPDRFWT